MAAALPFWTRVWRRKIQPQLESFISELVGYTLIFLGLIYVYLFLLFLRRIGIPEWLVAFMETADHVAIAITFTAFLVTLVRRAILTALQGEDDGSLCLSVYVVTFYSIIKLDGGMIPFQCSLRSHGLCF